MCIEIGRPEDKDWQTAKRGPQTSQGWPGVLSIVQDPLLSETEDGVLVWPWPHRSPDPLMRPGAARAQAGLGQGEAGRREPRLRAGPRDGRSRVVFQRIPSNPSSLGLDLEDLGAFLEVLGGF